MRFSAPCSIKIALLHQRCATVLLLHHLLKKILRPIRTPKKMLSHLFFLKTVITLLTGYIVPLAIFYGNSGDSNLLVCEPL